MHLCMNASIYVYDCVCVHTHTHAESQCQSCPTGASECCILENCMKWQPCARYLIYISTSNQYGVNSQ